MACTARVLHSRPVGAPTDAHGARARDHLRALVDGLPDAVLVVSSDGEIVLANARAIELFGDEVEGEPLVLSTVRDATERRQLEERYRRISESVSDMSFC